MLESQIDRWNRYIIYALLAVLPLERIPSLEIVGPVSATVRLSQLIGLLLIIVNLPRLWEHRKDILRLPWLPLAVFLGVLAVSTLYADNTVRALSVTLYTAFVAVLAWTLARTIEPSKFGTYAKIIIVSGVLAGLFGIYQFFGDLLGLSPSLTGLRPQYTSQVFGFPRIQSTGLEPLYFGNFLLIPLGLLLAALIRRPSWIAGAAFTFLASIIFITVSRGAIAALLLMALVALLAGAAMRRWRGMGVVLAGLAIGAVIALGLISTPKYIASAPTQKTTKSVDNFTKQATNVSQGESSEFRALSRRVAIDIFKDYPVLGVGPGNYGGEAQKRDPRRFKTDQAIVNNEPLELLAETGILGFSTFVAFALSLLVLFIRRITVIPVRPRMWASGLMLALLGMALQYQTFSTLYITHIWVTIGLLVGLLMFRYSKEHA